MNNMMNVGSISYIYSGAFQSTAKKSIATKASEKWNDFVSTMNNKVEIKPDAQETSFNIRDEIKRKYPGSYFNVMDTSKIDHGLWGRNDYPWDAYFSEPANSSVLDWTPNGAEPPMQDASVVSKINSMAGKLAVVIPPDLEKKMENDEALAQKVMNRVDGFIAQYYRAEANQGFLITFNENGDIGEACIACEGRITVSSSEFVEARREREKKSAEYEKIAAEKAARQRVMERERTKKEYKANSLSEFSDMFSMPVNAKVSELMASYEAGTFAGNGTI